MYKFLSVISVLLFISSTWAKPKQFLVCLGTEEAYYHKEKIGGAYSKLNQEMISAVVQLSDKITLKPKFEKKICSKRFVSVELLKFLVTEKQPIFQISSLTNIQQRAVEKNSIKELHEKSIFIFIDFLNSIQAQMKTANCLTKKIPELKIFFEKMRYTLEEVGHKQIFKEIKKPEIIFEKLQNLSATPKC